MSDSKVVPTPRVSASAPQVTLIVQKGAKKGMRIACRRVVTLIGSREGCKVRLADDAIAPAHLAIVNAGQHVTAVDLLSSKGTMLNGLQLEQELLSDGDRLVVGDWQFDVEIKAPAQEGSADLHPFELEPTPNLVALEQMDTGRILQPSREICVIGRRDKSDIVVSDDDVSRTHALLIHYFGFPAILDLLTRKGTFIDDERIGFHTLKDGQVLRVGNSSFRARLIGSNVVEEVAKKNGKVATPPKVMSKEEAIGDLIDIGRTEGKTRWHVAEKLDKLEKAEGKT
jgi:pSer/pThr/pTyr-binding forkhead associated (FHA) protein